MILVSFRLIMPNLNVSNLCPFTAAQCDRFGRQMILPQIGVDGMDNLFKSRVLIVGAGGLGSPICLYLSASGIGLSTLFRDIFFRSFDYR